MNPITVFYHCLFFIDGRVLPAAVPIVAEQMDALTKSGLLYECTEFHACINGGEESVPLADLIIPKKAERVFHGTQCRNEVRTIIELEKWLPAHSDWYVFYHHSKGASHAAADDFTATWRRCMERHCVWDWRKCVQDLDEGYEAVGCHYMEPPATPEGQHIFAGTFGWYKASYLLTLPPIMARDRIAVSGIDALESRYEGEVYWFNGPQLPKIKDYHGPDWNPSKIATCKL